MLSSLRQVPQKMLQRAVVPAMLRHLSVNSTILKKDHRVAVNALFLVVSKDKECKEAAQSRYIDGESWETFLGQTCHGVLMNPVAHLNEELYKELMNDVTFLSNPQNYTGTQMNVIHTKYKSKWLNLLLTKAEQDLQHVVDTNKLLASSSSLNKPMQWYPITRMMKRKIIFHGGPTNSGKTYHAIERLKNAAESEGGGIYCGPLRLLALEIYELLNRAGIKTNLITGQEVRMVPGAAHVSSTIEVISTVNQYDVAVIDEIQMISDPDRGSAWTRALLGLRAREIHCCGGLEAAALVQSLCQSTGDDFELKVYERLLPLQLEDQSLRGDYSKVAAGDCIVAFTINELFAIRKEITRRTKHKCAIIYGKLPPETRSMQARLFNDPNSGYDVLVASDAIGMGLNLNIRRIIFHTTLKKVGNRVADSLYIDPIAIKQIAGRAGRKSSQYPVGLVTAWQEIDLAYIRAVFNWDVPQITTAGVFPLPNQVQNFHLQLQQLLPEQNPKTEKNGSEIRFALLIDRFLQLSSVDSRYFLCNSDNLMTLSNWLHPIPLNIADRFTFASAPVKLYDGRVMRTFYRFAAQYALNHPVTLGISIKRSLPRSLEVFEELCTTHDIIDLYLWLSVRFPNNFIERDLCEKMKTVVVLLIEQSLQSQLKADNYTFQAKYQILRNKLNGGSMNSAETMILPPVEYGEKLREEVARNIASIPPEIRVLNITDGVKIDNPDSNLSRKMNDIETDENESKTLGLLVSEMEDTALSQSV